VWGYRTILLASFLVGFIGLGFEILWIRILLIVNKNTAYAFPSILFVFLLGLALGGYLFGRKADTSSNLVALFCKIELSAAIVAVFTLLLFWISLQYQPPWIEKFIDTQKPTLPFVEMEHQFSFSKRVLVVNLWNYFLPILILVLPASLVLGGGLPVLDRLSIQNPLLSGRRVGDIHLANILGSVVGSLAISFLLLPAFGSEWTMKLLVLSTFIFPALYFLPKVREPSFRTNDPSLISLGLFALVGVLLVPPRGEFYHRLYSYGTGQEAVISESGDSVLALTYETQNPHPAGWFWIGGEINSLFPAQGLYEERSLLCAGASRPKRILVIGFGGGFSTLFYRSIPDVEEIVVVELLSDIAPFLRRNMDSARVALDDPRITYLVDDGRRYLNASSEEKFDLISIDPLRMQTAGHNNLYSEEALNIYRDHLNPNGVLCAWMDEFHVIPHTAAQVFPFIDQYRNETMIASSQPIVYQTDYMKRVAADYAKLTQELYGSTGSIQLDHLAGFEFFQRDRNQILEDEKHRRILRDMAPWLEYYFFMLPVRERIEVDQDVKANFESRIR